MAKKYRIVKYVRVNVRPEEDQLFYTLKAITDEKKKCERANPENVYMIEIVSDE